MNRKEERDEFRKEIYMGYIERRTVIIDTFKVKIKQYLLPSNTSAASKWSITLSKM